MCCNMHCKYKVRERVWWRRHGQAKQFAISFFHTVPHYLGSHRCNFLCCWTAFLCTSERIKEDRTKRIETKRRNDRSHYYSSVNLIELLWYIPFRFAWKHSENDELYSNSARIVSDPFQFPLMLHITATIPHGIWQNMAHDFQPMPECHPTCIHTKTLPGPITFSPIHFCQPSQLCAPEYFCCMCAWACVCVCARL